MIARFAGVDAAADKYKFVSPYAYCINNPIILVDQDGREVKPMSASALKIITNGLTSDEAKYVRLNDQGFIDKNYLRQGTTELGKVGANFSGLTTLAESSQIIEVFDKNTFSTTTQTEDMGQPRFSSDLDDLAESPENKGKSKEEMAKNNPLVSTKPTWSGTFGITLYPDEDTGHGKSTDGNIQVIINSNLTNAGKPGERKKAAIFTHEALGHVLFKLLGKWHSHGTSLDPESPQYNKELEKQIKERGKEANENFDKNNP